MLNICANYVTRSLFDSGIIVANEGIRLAEASGNQKYVASFMSDKGMAFLMQGVNGSALDCFLKELKILETVHDSVALAACYSRIGILYMNMKTYGKAQLYLSKSIHLVPSKKNEESWMDYYGNMSVLYTEIGNYDSALYTLNASMAIAEKLGDKKKIAISLQNTGDVLIRLKRFREALDFTNRSIKETAESGMNYGTAQLYLNLGLCYTGLGDYPLAELNLNKALETEKNGESIDEERQIYEGYSNLYELEKDYTKAYNSHVLFTKYNDSIYSRENVSKLDDLKAAYEIDKQEELARLKEGEETLRESVKARKERVFDAGMLGAVGVMLVFAFLSYRGSRIKARATKVIGEQKEEIEKKNAELGEMNREVSDSIQYASRIQEAILPSLGAIQEILPKSFVLFLPKNVVSGDFYFFTRLSADEFILATCDCTGHGVPGAFMSMIGSEQLGKIIRDRGVTGPAAILNELHLGLRKALRQDLNETRDGIDLAICKINLKEKKMTYAGANRPCWIMNQESNGLVELKPDKQAVGGQESAAYRAFAEQEVILGAQDRVYLFSDGFADQFGGDKGKKLMVRNFKQLLLSVIHLPLPDQRKQLQAELVHWKGGLEQVDDILVIGFGI